jgi:hypothetical protein
VKYEDALQSLVNGRNIARLKTISQWEITRVVPDNDNPVSTIPILVRVEKDGSGKREPWTPNSADMFMADYVRADGQPDSPVVLDEGSWQQAFKRLRDGTRCRNVTWPKGAHLENEGEHLRFFLPNGTRGDIYRPNHVDVNGRWEIHAG